MRYLGGKARLAKHIVPIVQKYRISNEQFYIEPFCGGCNMLSKVAGKRIGIDSCEYIIAMWQALQNGWLPPKEVAVQEYRHIQQNKQAYPKELVGYVGYAISFGGKFFGGYQRSPYNPTKDYRLEGFNAVTRQSRELAGVKFIAANALRITKFPSESIIYCDPPYAGTTKYRHNFDSDMFWKWVNNICDAGNAVLVSERTAPSEWVNILSVEKFNGTYGTMTENVFIREDQKQNGN